MRYAIVTTTFNDETSIEDYLQNIMEQTVKPSEIVIADGGSTDSTCRLIETYRDSVKGVKIRLCTAGRLNIAEGFNLAIRSTEETVIGITGVGNYFPADYFEKLLCGMRRYEKEICYGTIRGQEKTAFQKLYNRAFLVTGQQCNIACNRGVLIKRQVFQKIGYFYEKFIYAGEDAEFFALAAERNIGMKWIEGADFIWETPANFHEFVKQTKFYTIARLQIEKNPRLLRNTILKLLVLSVLPAAICCYPPAFIVLPAAVFVLARRNHIQNIGSAGLYLIYKLLVVFYTIRYAGYMRSVYKVRR